MHPEEFNKLGNNDNPEYSQRYQKPPTPTKSGLRRQEGSARLLTPTKTFQNPPLSFSNLQSSGSVVRSLTPLQPFTPKPRSTLTRTKTSILPIGYDTFPDISTPKKPEKPQDIKTDETTPPGLRRTLSGSMLLRQTPERIRRQEEDDVGTSSGMTSPRKGIRRSGSLPKLMREDVVEDVGSMQTTPVLKRKRTSSLTALHPPSSMPQLTPQRLRPRAPSETRLELISPIKKRLRQDSSSNSSRPSSPLKKRYISTATIRFSGGQDEPSTSTPQLLKKNKSTIGFRQMFSERIQQNYGIASAKIQENPISIAVTTNPPNPLNVQPHLGTRSTSGDTYYTANEGDEQSQEVDDVVQQKKKTSFGEEEGIQKTSGASVVRGQNEEDGGQDVEMVPLVKKQMSIDEKSHLEQEEDEDEGFGDSTKTIKRGQGGALARSLSLKLSPRKDSIEQKPIGADTEKSCSTPSLPTAPLLRHGSTSSLRFKVSPSTFLRSSPVIPSTPSETPTSSVAITPEAAPPLPVVTAVEPSEPSTSTMKTSSEVTSATPSKKSALKKQEGKFTIREDGFGAPRRRNVKYEGLKVYYFDRRQGASTVPSEGEISLDMHNTHHTHRYFPLSTGKRPILDLSLYDDEDLSDGEVIHPDSDEESHDYEEFTSAKFLSPVNQKFRIKLLKKAGVKVEKVQESMEILRKIRTECGCSCENGVCLPETCQCSIDGIQCQVDGGEYPTTPCGCFAETCTNPSGRIEYDPDAVHDFRVRTIMNWKAAQRSGVTGSPVVKKFAGESDEEEDFCTTGEIDKKWLLKKAIPVQKLETSPTKYPVTPVYTRRSRSSLSDIRESSSETAMSSGITPSTSLSERIKAMQNLDNEVCAEVEKEDEEDTVEQMEQDQPDDEQDMTVIRMDTFESDVTVREVYVESIPTNDEMLDEPTENELIESAMSPVTLVV